ncbi:hypothetical protein AC578_6809 [Pseudocercospora eumusae]|uniref:Uncharacterized protein n=1 Tax=Pseudocercospora eumusae TaxID=321146 RepID=A0A139GWA7_9PEZI|nr:hypothetical protein AC578_6809 [Pseudocercospora eumusae]
MNPQARQQQPAAAQVPPDQPQRRNAQARTQRLTAAAGNHANETPTEFGNGRYDKLASKLIRAENKYAPSETSSRLLMHENTMDEKMILLLARRSHRQLRMIFNNKLSQHTIRGAPERLREPSGARKAMDPVIYSNYIVTKDGLGLPMGEFRKLLAAVELVTTRIVSPGNQRRRGD